MAKTHNWAEYYQYIAVCANKKSITTASQLSQEAGISEAVISKIKTGDSKSPSFDTIYAICEATGASIDVMCGLKADSNEEVDAILAKLEEQKRVNAELTHQNELLKVHVQDKDERLDSLRTSKKMLLKWLSIVSTILAVFTIVFIGLLIYDKLNPHMGWFTAFSGLSDTIQLF